MAAGLGFKTFTTGEVLTAADTNGYLMQGVLVFASAAARDAAITSPQEGQCCYLKDTDAVLTYSGAAWVGFDDSNAVQNSIVDAKGDLIAASAADTPARLAVGNNGEQIVADSAATTGLRYSATPSASNPIINSAFQVWQRGTSFAGGGAGGIYTADRFQLNAATAQTMSRQVTGDTTNLPFVQYCARIQRTAASTNTTAVYVASSFESVNCIPYAGKGVTLSFYARVGANWAGTSFGVQLVSGTGTDQNLNSGFTGSANVISVAPTFTTTWQRFTYTGTVASTATQLGLLVSWLPSGTAGAADYVEMTGFQIDIGSVALPFRTYAATIQGELAACQRYYYRTTVGVNQNTGYTTINYSTTAAIATLPMKVTMRVAPTVLDYSNIHIYDSVTGFPITGLALWSASTTDTSGLLATGATGMTQFRSGILTATASAGYIGLSAEL